ncbi:MAG: hypothetical protein AAGG38_05320 [Planctomycetota bacterium]
MAQIKDKVNHFFAWARQGKKPVSVDVARRDEDAANGKDVSIQQLKQGYGEVVETMKTVRSHLEQQSSRSEQMLELMRDLPAVLQSIPESTQTQTRMLEAIHTNLDRQNQTTDQLASAITGLTSAAGQQEKALTQIRDHLADEDDTRGQLNQGVAALNDTLGQVTASNQATRESMGAVVEQTRVNDERMRHMYQRSQKMNTMMVLLCLALATGALALGGYMAVLVSRVVEPAPAATQTTPADAPAPSPTPEAFIDPAPHQNPGQTIDIQGPPAPTDG